MGKIRILSDQICNHIAAGEVIERPAAVLKELLENSIDAKADTITVNFKGGGQNLIEVIDNGEGMDREDALLCIERHSTSKISSLKDLASITSMGFRGEALASISAVSRMKIITKTETETAGTEIYVEGGKLKYVKDAGCNRGCVVQVRNLFFNVPARKKFLKTETTERNHLIDCFIRLAIPFPEIHFRMNHGNKSLYNLPSTKDLKERIFQIFGEEITERLHSFELKENGYSIGGYVGDTNISRPTPKQVYLFVNRRPVKDSFLNRVIRETYNQMTKGYYPFTVLFLDLNPELVDVNVHPSKREVKFRNVQKVTYLLQKAITEAISSSMEKSCKPSSAEKYSEKNKFSEVNSENKRLFLKEQQIPLYTAVKNHSPQKGFFSSLSILCQVDQTYIVCRNHDGIVLIDFHAAHERILYNYIKEKSLPIPSQNLLKPITFTIFQEEIETIENNRDTLLEFGYDVDVLDKHTAVIRAIPAIAKHVDHISVVQDMLKIMSTFNKKSDIIESFLSSLACHRALRSGKNLNHAEIVWLLQEMDKQNFINTCPHGRPVWIKLSGSDLAKLFKRS